MKNLKYFLIFGLLFQSFVEMAQDVGNNTMVIVGGFTPEIKDTKKISFKPQLPDTNYEAPKFNYSIVSSQIQTSFQPRPITAAKMSGEMLDKVYQGYVMAGMGNYASPMFELLYGMGRSRDEIWGIQLKHFSSAGKIADYIFPGISTNMVRGYYTKLYDKNKLTADAYYKRSMYHYYGVNIQDTAIANSGDLTDNANAHLFNKASVYLNYGRYDLKRTKMNFNLGTKYYYLIDNYGTRENSVNFDGFVDWKVNLFSSIEDQKIGLNTIFDFYNNSDSLTLNNVFVLTVNPYFNFKASKLDFELGLNADFSDDTISELRFFPNVKIGVDIIDKLLNFEIIMEGKTVKNNLNALSAENPFINSILPMEISTNRFHTSIAMYSSISKYINLQLGMDYQKWENGAFFVTDTTIKLRNKFTVIYSDYDMLKLHAGLTFHMSDHIDLLADANYFVYTSDLLFAWHKPDFEVKFNGQYLIGDKIVIHADLVYRGPSKAPVYINGDLYGETLKAWLDVSAGIEYRYHKRFGIFANFNNITASQYQYWYNYPSYGFNFMAGVNYIF